MNIDNIFTRFISVNFSCYLKINLIDSKDSELPQQSNSAYDYNSFSIFAFRHRRSYEVLLFKFYLNRNLSELYLKMEPIHRKEFVVNGKPFEFPTLITIPLDKDISSSIIDVMQNKIGPTMEEYFKGSPIDLSNEEDYDMIFIVDGHIEKLKNFKPYLFMKEKWKIIFPQDALKKYDEYGPEDPTSPLTIECDVLIEKTNPDYVYIVYKNDLWIIEKSRYEDVIYDEKLYCLRVEE